MEDKIHRVAHDRRIGLDIVRATAIGLVLASHFIHRIDITGIYGVELFFALSGYLIGGILYRRLVACDRWDFNEIKIFWQRRWWRTLPNYYLFLLICIPFHYLSGNLPSIAELSKYLIFAQRIGETDPSFYGVSWSLCIEEWFYLLFPLSILALLSVGIHRRSAFIGTALIFLIIPPLLRYSLLNGVAWEIVRKTTIPRLDAIVYGVAVSFAVSHFRTTMVIRIALLYLSAIGLTALLLFDFVWAQSDDEHRYIAMSSMIAMPACFALSLPYFSTISSLPRTASWLEKPINCISLWSYSIYLGHMPILTVVYAAFGEARSNPAINFLSKIIGLAICLLISRFIYINFEAKMMAMRPAEPKTCA